MNVSFYAGDVYILLFTVYIKERIMQIITIFKIMCIFTQNKEIALF